MTHVQVRKMISSTDEARAVETEPLLVNHSYLCGLRIKVQK